VIDYLHFSNQPALILAADDENPSISQRRDSMSPAWDIERDRRKTNSW